MLPPVKKSARKVVAGGTPNPVQKKGFCFMKLIFRSFLRDLPRLPVGLSLVRRDKTWGLKKEEVKEILRTQYGPGLLIAATLTVGLNILDAFFTMLILDQGGEEANPIVAAAMEAWGEHFWIWKYALVSSNIVLLCLHSHLKYVKSSIFGVCFFYLALVVYQLVLLRLHGS